MKRGGEEFFKQFKGCIRLYVSSLGYSTKYRTSGIMTSGVESDVTHTLCCSVASCLPAGLHDYVNAHESPLQ